MTPRGKVGGRIQNSASPGRIANEHPGHPFGTIESAHEYVTLLLQAVGETAANLGEDLHRTPSAGAARHREAFQLVAYKLEQLRFHVATSGRLLNDLRTLRRMLHGERSASLARVGIEES